MMYAIKPHIASLRKYNYGKHIISAFIYLFFYLFKHFIIPIFENT